MLGLHCDEIKLPTPAKQTATGHVQLPILWAPTSHNANRRSAGLIQHPIPAMYLLTSANALNTFPDSLEERYMGQLLGPLLEF